MSRKTSQSRFLPTSFRISGLVKAWEAAARAAQGPPAPSGPTSVEKSVAIFRLTDPLARTPRRLGNPHALTGSPADKSQAPTPQMPGNLSITPKEIERMPVCLALDINSTALLTPPDSDKDRPLAIVPQTPESPTPQRDTSLNPSSTLKLGEDPHPKSEWLMSASCSATLPTADSHLPSPPPSPDSELPVKTIVSTHTEVEPLSGGGVAPKIYREMCVQTDPINVFIPRKRYKHPATVPGDFVAPITKKSHVDSQGQDESTEVVVSKESIQEVKALLTSIESMECVKDLAANILEAKALLADIASLDYVKATVPYLGIPSARNKAVDDDTDTTISCSPAPSATTLYLTAGPVHSTEDVASDVSHLPSDADEGRDSVLSLSRVPPNSLVDDLCDVAMSPNGKRQWQLVIRKLGYCTVAYKLERPAPDNWDDLPIRRRRSPQVSPEFADMKMQVCRGLVLAELKSFHKHGKKLSPVA